MRNRISCINCDVADHSVSEIINAGCCRHARCKLVVLVNGHIKSATIHLGFSGCPGDRGQCISFIPLAQAVWILTVNGFVQHTYATGNFKTK